MTSIPDLIANWCKRRLDGDVSFGVLVDETIDLLTRLTAPDDEGLEPTDRIIAHVQQALRDYGIPEDTIRNDPEIASATREAFGDFDLIRAKLRAAEARADRYEAALTSANGELALAKDMASFTAEQKAGCVERAFAFIAAALNQEPKP
jgi:hypothetical protein